MNEVVTVVLSFESTVSVDASLSLNDVINAVKQNFVASVKNENIFPPNSAEWQVKTHAYLSD